LAREAAMSTLDVEVGHAKVLLRKVPLSYNFYIFLIFYTDRR
jgi:hypothetical protein